MLVDLRHLTTSTKSIPSFHDWNEDGPDLNWISPLDVDGVTLEGLRLRLKALATLPEEQVCAQLEFQQPGNRCQPLVRVEWRPLRGHSNKHIGPQEWRLKVFKQTHVHRFDDNWLQTEQRMRAGNLPVAVPIEDVDSYKKFLDICSLELKIANMPQMPLPPWHRRML